MPEPEFDPRLMTADRLHRLAGKHPLRLSTKNDGTIHCIRCVDCAQAIMPLEDTSDVPYRWSAGQLLQDVLRHRVMAHGLALSGKDDHGS